MQKKPARTGRITPTVLLDHMRGMERRLHSGINNVRTELKEEMQGLRTELKDDIQRLERKVNIISVQVADIDARLDDLEVVQMPKVKKAIGMR